MSTVPGRVSVREAQERLLNIEQKLKQQSTIPVGGRLRFFWQQWRKLGAPKKVIRWLRKGYALPFKRDEGQGKLVTLTDTCPAGLVTEYKAGSEKDVALRAKIQELLD